MTQQKKIKAFSDVAWGLGVGGVGGLGMAAPVVVALFVGYWLDSRFNTFPLLTAVLGASGMVSGLFSVYRWATNAVRFRMQVTGRLKTGDTLHGTPPSFEVGSSFIKFALLCGLAIIGPMLLLLGLGYWLDMLFGSLPWLTVIMLHVGVCVGHFFAYKLTTSHARKDVGVPGQDQSLREGSEK